MNYCDRISSHTGTGGSYGRWGQSAYHYRLVDNVNVSCWHESCNDEESLDLFARRGWIVIRDLVPKEEIKEIISKWNGDCYPQVTETSDGRMRCAISYDQIRDVHNLFSNASAFLNRVESIYDDIGKNLHIMRCNTAVRKINVHRHRIFKWHLDNSGSKGTHNFHWIFVMLKKNVDKANLCLASLKNVDCFDSPVARTSGEWDKNVLEPSKCCPELNPGDAVFYTEDVAHRTEKFNIDGNRYALSIKIETDRPIFDGRKEPRCALWYKYCDTERRFMDCVCPHVCNHDEL